jgi:hypothetical protein
MAENPKPSRDAGTFEPGLRNGPAGHGARDSHAGASSAQSHAGNHRDAALMSEATRTLHEALLRNFKGMVSAYEKWLSQQ